jgi:hypothetical protein
MRRPSVAYSSNSTRPGAMPMPTPRDSPTMPIPLLRGSHSKGRTAIAESHSPLFEGILRGSRLTGRPTALRFLASEVTLVHSTGRWSWRAVRSPSKPWSRSNMRTAGASLRSRIWAIARSLGPSWGKCCCASPRAASGCRVLQRSRIRCASPPQTPSHYQGRDLAVDVVTYPVLCSTGVDAISSTIGENSFTKKT